MSDSVVLSSTDGGDVVERGSAPSAETLHYASKARSDRTREAYARDWDRFVTWCESKGLSPLPAAAVDVANYLSYHAALRSAEDRPVYAAATIKRWAASINAVHRIANQPTPGAFPEVAEVLRGIRNETGRARGTRRMKPLLRDQLLQVVESIPRLVYPQGVGGVRDMALLIFGFAGAFRRDELAELKVGDIELDIDTGLRILVRFSKTDQAGEGFYKSIPHGSNPATCGPCAYVRWLRVLAATERSDVMAALYSAADINQHICRRGTPEVDPDQYLFCAVHRSGKIRDGRLTGHAINLIIKRRVELVGADPQKFGGHSLRAGFVTQAIRGGATTLEIMHQTGHKNPATIEIYARENDPHKANAVNNLGL